MIHCYTGTPEAAKAFLDLGFYISFSGIVTFRLADNVRAAAAVVPDDRILIETDESPELFGRILAEAAAMHLLSPSELAATVHANFKRIFRHDPV